MNWKMSTQINQKDANQDQEIALLKHRIEDVEKLAEELRNRVRKLEKWVWGAGAVITALISIVGIATAANSEEIDGGTKDMNLEALRVIRREHGTLVE